MTRLSDARDAWYKTIENLRVGSVRGAPAVNKPLLVLLILARATRGFANKFKYPELEHEIRNALVKFGPPLKSVAPSRAFMHLQGDGFWNIVTPHPLLNADKADLVSQGKLREPGVYATVRTDLWDELLNDPTLARDLANLVADKYLPSQDKSAIADFFGIALE